jgi:hypothetical protein
VKAESYKRNSTVSLDNLKPSEVHERTGFEDVRELLFYVAVVCDGDHNRMTETTLYLTWFEEWFFYFEMTYGHSANRWCDYERSYKMTVNVLRELYRRKLTMAILTRKRWPLYATHKEDVQLRKPSWNEIFTIIKGERIVMHDNTDAVRLMKASDPEMQRATWSKYYGGCVGKGGIACQLCGWTVTLELCTGAIDDSSYIDAVQILRLQDDFAKNDPTSERPFTNVFDKGYRCILAALEQGLQVCLQPTFAQSDRKFSTNNVLHSAGVAAIRSGNERAVRQTKLSWMIKRGCSYHQPWDLDMQCDIWLAWGFQINFMYDAVH